VDDLAAFFNARLDEAEATAHAAGGKAWTQRHGVGSTPALSQGVVNGRGRAGSSDHFVIPPPVDGRGSFEVDATHVARHDPAAVLADVDSKRRILAEHQAGPGGCITCTDRDYPEDYPCATAKLLVLPFASHPDYREGWAV